MQLGLNNNYNAKQSFGMAVSFDNSAKPIIKKQAAKLSKNAYEKFWGNIKETTVRQAENPNNIFIRKAKHRQALVAEVYDANTDIAMKNYITAQGLLSRNGSLKFLKRAEAHADKLKDMNERLEQLSTK